MLKFNMFVYYLGIILTTVGCVVGLPMLMFGENFIYEIGKYMVTMVVPFGFLLWFSGFTAYQLIRPNGYRKEDEDKVYHRQVPD